MNRTHNLFSIAAMMHGGEENLAVSNDPKQLILNAAGVAKNEVLANAAGKPMTDEQKRAMFAKGGGGGGGFGGGGSGGGRRSSGGSINRNPDLDRPRVTAAAASLPARHRNMADNLVKWRDDYKKGIIGQGTVLINGKPYFDLGGGEYAPLDPDQPVIGRDQMPGLIDGDGGRTGGGEFSVPSAPGTASDVTNPVTLPGGAVQPVYKPQSGSIAIPPTMPGDPILDPSMPRPLAGGQPIPTESPYALAKRAAAEGALKTPHSKSDLKDPNASKVGLKIPGSEKGPTDATPKGGWFIDPAQPAQPAQPVPVKPRPVISVKPKPKTVLPVRMTSPHMTFSKSTISGGTMTSDYKINSLRDAFHRWQKK